MRTSIAYDAKSNVTKKTLKPKPGAIDLLTGLPATEIVEEWIYHPTSNKVATYKDPRGNTTSYTYNTLGNSTHTTQPAIAKPGGGSTVSPVTTITYGSRGLPATTIDAEGRVTTFAYAPTTLDLMRAPQYLVHQAIDATANLIGPA